MTRHKLHYADFKTVKTKVYAVEDLAQEIHKKEKELIEKLYWIDKKRYFVLYGFKSLTGFCTKALRLTKTQAQRIVTQVRRYEPTDNIGLESEIVIRRPTMKPGKKQLYFKIDT